MNVADRFDAETRSAVEREAIAAALTAAALEADRQRRAVERELGLGLARKCGRCEQWRALGHFSHDGAAMCLVCQQ